MPKPDLIEPKRKTTASILVAPHRRAQIAANLVGENLLDFLSKAADDRSTPILKKHGVKLPADALQSSHAI